MIKSIQYIDSLCKRDAQELLGPLGDLNLSIPYLCRYPEEQTSITVRLKGGKAYYMQAVCGQDVEKSSCSVGMQMPNGRLSRPIKGEYLSRAPLGMIIL